MGNPENFGFEVPQRCQRLIENLWPTVSKRGETGSAPLNATFLLAISIPMVNLPIERIWKAARKNNVGHTNDSVLNQNLATTIRKTIEKSNIKEAPFFNPTVWRYHYLPKGPGFPNLSQHGIPNLVEIGLADDAAIQEAANLSGKLFCEIIRNGLAHGGILYLDGEGRATHGSPVKMFCFVSTKLDDKRRPEGLHFLRIKMKDYREFLDLWTRWLKQAADIH